MMIKKLGLKIISLFMMFSLILGLCGCSLAVENADGERTKDRLVGGFVTREYIEEKTYATYEAWVYKGTPEEYKTGIEFGDIKGQLFYFDEKEDENGETSRSFYNSGFDVDQDEENSSVVIKLSNQFYYVPGETTEENMLHLNPVYETPEGELYVVPGNSASMGEGMDQAGASCALSLSEEEKITYGEQYVLERVEISAEFIVTYEPVKIAISQIDENEKVIKKEEYLIEEIPFVEYPVEEKTDYVLIETEVLLPDGGTAVQREISEWDGTKTTYSVNDVEKERNQSKFYTYKSDENGFLNKKMILFIWP